MRMWLKHELWLIPSVVHIVSTCTLPVCVFPVTEAVPTHVATYMYANTYTGHASSGGRTDSRPSQKDLIIPERDHQCLGNLIGHSSALNKQSHRVLFADT